MGNDSLDKMKVWHKQCIDGKIDDMTSIGMDIPIPIPLKETIKNLSYMEDIIREALSCLIMKLMIVLRENGQDEFQKLWAELCNPNQSNFMEWLTKLGNKVEGK